MDDALLVRRRQPARKLNAGIDGFATRHGTAKQDVPQRFSFEQLRNQVGCAFKRSKLEDGKDVGMVESSRRLRLLLKSPQAVGVFRNISRQYFDLYVAR